MIIIMILEILSGNKGNKKYFENTWNTNICE